MKRPEPFDGPTRRNRSVDAAVAVAVFALAAGQILLDSDLTPRWASATVGAGLSLSLGWRSTRPRLAVAGVTASFAFAAATGVPEQSFIVMGFAAMAAVWTAAAWLPTGPSLIGLGMVTAASVTALRGPGSNLLENLSWVSILLGGVWGASRALRSRAELIVRLQQTTFELEESKAAQTRAEIATERARIARELHDVVAHAVSVMVIQTAAARKVLPSDAQKSAEALAAVEQSGRQALTELRHLLQVLRPADQSTGLTPQPGLSELPELLDRLDKAGLHVTVTETGPAMALPSGASLTAYRVIQEALTNVLRHAGTNTAALHLAYSNGALEIDTTNDGPLVPPPDRTGGGLGLIGMQERVSSHGGSLSYGPLPTGGFRIHATLPGWTDT
ncbi:MAG: sensor histidine kinase [Actinomycetota bacterium]|nr:sensor histidine kinase [Actinomycetota bacterium]